MGGIIPCHGIRFRLQNWEQRPTKGGLPPRGSAGRYRGKGVGLRLDEIYIKKARDFPALRYIEFGFLLPAVAVSFGAVISLVYTELPATDFL